MWMRKRIFKRLNLLKEHLEGYREENAYLRCIEAEAQIKALEYFLLTYTADYIEFQEIVYEALTDNIGRGLDPIISAKISEDIANEMWEREYKNEK
jgi:hypothetical protein